MRYHNSDAGWVERLPEHWDEARLRFVTTINPSKNEIAHRAGSDEVTFLPMEAVGEDGSIDVSRTKPIAEVATGYTYFRNGDVLVAKITPCFENGKAALVHGLIGGCGFGSTEFHVLRVSRNLHSEFLKYFVRSRPFRALGTASMYGAGGQKRVPADFIQDLVIPLPPMSEQASIVSFLDKETARLDALIVQQTEFVQQTKARQEALLSSLHENSCLAPKVRLRFAADILPGNAFPSESFELSQRGVRLLRGINVNPGQVNWDAGTVYLSQTDTLNFERFNLLPDDVVVGMDRPWISTGLRVARLCVEDTPSLLVQRVARLRCKSKIDPEYLEFCLRTRQFMAHVLPDMTGVSVPHISDRQIGDFRVPLPTIDEQRRLASEIRRRMAFGNDLISKIENMITVARERRSALITAAIIGQIDVAQPTLTEAAA